MLDSISSQPLLTCHHFGSVNPKRSQPPSQSHPPNPILWKVPPPNPEYFALLEKGHTKKLRDSFEKGTTIPPPTAATAWPSQGTDGQETTKPEEPNYPMKEVVAPSSDTLTSATRPPEAKENPSGKPKTLAQIVSDTPDPRGPQVFDPEKISDIGYATLSNGISALYFSAAETKKLEDNMGLAIVGKFSHSIPATYQIQKALTNIKFKRGVTWKQINAKHILIQLEDLADYARLLSGPKGTPVWYINRHPMRVFKWTSQFDFYCESPVAAIWCNLIALPIHLYDTAALFAICKLLGTLIQINHATSIKTRLSFARICVEIDITKAPTEEIILDIYGRETIFHVRWDKIPPYCSECRHVGH